MLVNDDAIVHEALAGDPHVIDLFDEHGREVLTFARRLYRDGNTPDAAIAELIGAIERWPRVSLH